MGYLYETSAIRSVLGVVLENCGRNQGKSVLFVNNPKSVGYSRKKVPLAANAREQYKMSWTVTQRDIGLNGSILSRRGTSLQNTKRKITSAGNKIGRPYPRLA